MYRRNPLRALLGPKSIAVLGSKSTFPAAWKRLVENLRVAESIKFVEVETDNGTLKGEEAVPSRWCSQIPATTDLALVLSPHKDVPDIMKGCSGAGVKLVIILNQATTDVSSEYEYDRSQRPSAQNLRIVGPDSSGVVVPRMKLNASVAPHCPQPGSIGVVFQGPGGTGYLDWCCFNNVGLSAFVSLGNMADIAWGESLNLMREDWKTKAVCLIMASVKDAAGLVSAARETALRKPIVVMKIGRSEKTAPAVVQYSGTRPSSDVVLDAVFNRCGILRVDTLSSLFKTTQFMALQPLPKGKRLLIVTNSGAAGVMAADTLVYGGGALAHAGKELVEAGYSTNPVIIANGSHVQHYVNVLRAALEDEENDCVLCILTPNPDIGPEELAPAMINALPSAPKPRMACWMGGNPEVAKARQSLLNAGIPAYELPDDCSRVFNHAHSYSWQLQSIYETPSLPSLTDVVSKLKVEAKALIQAARQHGQRKLSNQDADALLKTCGIDLNMSASNSPGNIVLSPSKSRKRKRRSSVVISRATGTFSMHEVETSESDADASATALQTWEKLCSNPHSGSTYSLPVTGGQEISLRSWVDPEFGPIMSLVVGAAPGYSVVGLPPLTSTLAGRMIDRTPLWESLVRIAGDEDKARRCVDILIDSMVLYSQIISEFWEIESSSIDPLLLVPEPVSATEGQDGPKLLAVQASIELFDNSKTRNDIPKPAIAPYPDRYVKFVSDRNGEQILLRPVRAEDEPLMVNFHKDLSDRSVQLRYFQNIPLPKRISHERLSRGCFIDYSKEMALLALDNSGLLLGVGRIYLVEPVPGTEAEYAILVHDRAQKRGIGSILMQGIIDVARDFRVSAITGEVLPNNLGMKVGLGVLIDWSICGSLRLILKGGSLIPRIRNVIKALCKKFSFTARYDQDDGVVKMKLAL